MFLSTSIVRAFIRGLAKGSEAHRFLFTEGMASRPALRERKTACRFKSAIAYTGKPVKKMSKCCLVNGLDIRLECQTIIQKVVELSEIIQPSTLTLNLLGVRWEMYFGCT